MLEPCLEPRSWLWFGPRRSSLGRMPSEPQSFRGSFEPTNGWWIMPRGSFSGCFGLLGRQLLRSRCYFGLLRLSGLLRQVPAGWSEWRFLLGGFLGVFCCSSAAGFVAGGGFLCHDLSWLYLHPGLGAARGRLAVGWAAAAAAGIPMVWCCRRSLRPLVTQGCLVLVCMRGVAWHFGAAAAAGCIAACNVGGSCLCARCGRCIVLLFVLHANLA